MAIHGLFEEQVVQKAQWPVGKSIRLYSNTRAWVQSPPMIGLVFNIVD